MKPVSHDRGRCDPGEFCLKIESRVVKTPELIKGRNYSSDFSLKLELLEKARPLSVAVLKPTAFFERQSTAIYHSVLISRL